MSADKPTLGLGNARDWLTPLRPDGSRKYETHGDEEIIGCHTGHSAGLNVRNPLPGYDYMWGSRDPRRLLVERQRGYEVVQDSDSDGPAWKSEAVGGDHDAPTPLDTANVYQDIVLLRIRSDRLAELRAAEQQHARSLLDSGTRAFIERASPDEMLSGHGRATRMARSDHVTNLMDGDEIVEQHAPDEGTPRI